MESGCVGDYVTPNVLLPRDGYSFLGWTEDPESKVPDYYPGEAIPLVTDTEYYAVYKTESFEIGFNANDGSALRQAKQYNYGDDALLNEIYERNDAYFLGWSASPDALIPEFAVGITIPVMANLELYAIWGNPDFLLSESLNMIDEEAFEGCAFCFVEVPEQTERIGSRAFADCAQLHYIKISGYDTMIDLDAFTGVSDLTIYGIPGSKAELFALQNGYSFVAA